MKAAIIATAFSVASADKTPCAEQTTINSIAADYTLSVDCQNAKTQLFSMSDAPDTCVANCYTAFCPSQGATGPCVLSADNAKTAVATATASMAGCYVPLTLTGLTATPALHTCANGDNFEGTWTLPTSFAVPDGTKGTVSLVFVADTANACKMTDDTKKGNYKEQAAADTQATCTALSLDTPTATTYTWADDSSTLTTAALPVDDIALPLGFNINTCTSAGSNAYMPKGTDPASVATITFEAFDSVPICGGATSSSTATAATATAGTGVTQPASTAAAGVTLLVTGVSAAALVASLL